jgi:hypothetical protein
MNKIDEMEPLEKAGSFVSGIADWFDTNVPIAQANVWWVASGLLLLAALLSAYGRWQLVRPKALVPHTWRSRLRLNPSMSGARHARP